MNQISIQFSNTIPKKKKRKEKKKRKTQTNKQTFFVHEI